MKRLLLITALSLLLAPVFAEDSSHVFETEVHSNKTEHVKVSHFGYCTGKDAACTLDTYWDYIEKDGHHWIVISSRYENKNQIELPIQVIHDPNCPCQKRRDQWMQNLYEAVNKLYNLVKSKLK